MSRFFASMRIALAILLTTFRETLFEGGRVVWTSEEIRNGVGRGNVATWREDLVAIPVRVGDVHQAIRESTSDVRRQDTRPQVRRVCGGVRLAAHVLPVHRPVAAVELREARLLVGDLTRQTARVTSVR